MKSFFRSRYVAIGAGTLIVLGVFLLGVLVGYDRRPDIERIAELDKKELEKPAQVDFSPFWKAWNVINDKYVGEEKNDTQAKVWGAIEGLARSLNDPYTVFMPPEETKNFDTEISGSFEGVGMEIGLRDGVVSVVSPIKGSPAERAGVKMGDKILKINDKSTVDFTVEQAVKLIKGPKGTQVTLTLYREGKKQAFDLKITRDVINLPTLDTELRADGIFVIKLYNFNQLSNNLFRDALQQFINADTDKMLIDLRGNPGGYLDYAIDMASWFLPKDKIVVRESFGDGRKEEVMKSNGYNIFTDKLKLVILVNEGSASASEILAGALSEHKKATLVGTKTFGKGSVQELVKITHDTNLKVTIARWLTPQGVSISEKGITPDHEVKMTPEDVDKGKDPQMDKAVSILLGKVK